MKHTVKVLSSLPINAVVAFSSPDLSPVLLSLSPVTLAVLPQQAVKEKSSSQP